MTLDPSLSLHGAIMQKKTWLWNWCRISEPLDDREGSQISDFGRCLLK